MSTNKYINQNLWKGPIDKKKLAIIDVLTRSNHRNQLRINFLSQQVDVKSISTPLGFSEKYKKWFIDTIKEKKSNDLGVVITDFIDAEFAAAVYKTNS